MEKGVRHRGSYWDPMTGERKEVGEVSRAVVAPPGWGHDWVVVMKRQ
jgi:hypothetical protein